jgi:hypothetical protein
MESRLTHRTAIFQNRYGRLWKVGLRIVQRFSKIVTADYGKSAYTLYNDFPKSLQPTMESQLTHCTTIFQNRYSRLWKVGLHTVQRFSKIVMTDFGKSVYRRRPCFGFGLLASAATDALAAMYSSRPMSSPSRSCFSLLPLSRHSAMAWPNCQKAAFWP